MGVFNMLNRLYSVMDYVCSLFPSLHKVETIGDAYMVVGGINDCSTEEDKIRVIHDILKFAFIVKNAVTYVPLDETSFVKLRIGMHCGEIVTGITGKLTPRYCCFGDTINVCARMEQTGSIDEIHISSTLASVIKHLSKAYDYECVKRDEKILVKGKGLMETSWLRASEFLDVNKKYDVYIRKAQSIVNNLNDNCFWSLPEPIVTSTIISNNTVDNLTDNRLLTTNKVSTLSKIVSTYCLTGMIGGDIDFPSFKDLSSFEFDVLKISSDDDSEICSFITLLFKGMVDLFSIDVDENILHNYVTKIASNYRKVPYHNIHHAFCVVQFTAALMVKSRVQRLIPEKELFGLLISSLIHDVDHPGLNNSFAVRTSSKLAIIYNDVSVLENHHIALGFSIMQMSKEYNIIGQWDTSDAKMFRKLVIQCIISTDMALHNKMIKELNYHAQQNPHHFDMDNEKDRLSFYRFILHGADISNSVRPHSISYHISQLVAAEFRNQSEQEKKLGLEVTPFMVLPDDLAIAKSEIGFLENVAKPYWVSMVSCIEGLSPLLKSLD